jgi:hypothetical protein
MSKHDDARVGKLRPNGDHYIAAASIRETKVHHRNVGSQGAAQPQPVGLRQCTFHDAIELGLSRGRNAMAMWQDYSEPTNKNTSKATFG